MTEGQCEMQTALPVLQVSATALFMALVAVRAVASFSQRLSGVTALSGIQRFETEFSGLLKGSF
jgi:hypothetical protein